MSTQSQNARILAYLRKGHRITFLEALGRFGIMHLARRILDLKEAVHTIEDDWVSENGKRFKEYWLGASNG